MNDFIFTPVKLKKSGFYSWLKTMLNDNGWRNISSKPSTDNDIFYSNGETGNDEILFRIKEYYNADVNNTITNSAYVNLSVLPLRSYTPGVNGASGSINPSTGNSGFYNDRIAQNNVISKESDMTVYYHCNKDRIVYIVEWPDYLGMDATFHLYGKPYNILSKKPMTTQTVTLSGLAYSSISPAISDIADLNSTSYFSGDLNYFSPPRFINSNNMMFMSDISITHKDNGFHALVDGIFAINSDPSVTSNSALKGDELIDSEGRVYRITPIARSAGSNYPATSFPLIAFRIL